MMNLLDLVYDCRLRADDLGGDTGTVPHGYSYYFEYSDAGALWKNAEWVRFLNYAHQEIALRTNCYRDSLGGTTVTTYGENLLTTSGWTVGTGWVESTDDVFTHSAGTAQLTHSATIANVTSYRLTYTLSGVTAGSVTLAVGGASIAGIGSSGLIDITTSSTSGFAVTPTNDFVGTLTVSLKAITTPVTNPFAISVISGTAVYNLDSRIITVEDVRLNSSNANLVKWTLDDYRALASQYTATGTPTNYIEELTPFRIRLYPIPTANDTLYLTVYRYPLADFAWATRNVTLTEPSDFWREALIQGALMYAYQKRDADTVDPKRIAFHEMQFNKLVGPPVDYRTLENRRWNANMDITIRPSRYIRPMNSSSWMDE